MRLSVPGSAFGARGYAFGARGSTLGRVCIWEGGGQIPTAHVRYYGIRSMSGLYVSYWNAFLSYVQQSFK